jgi:hypothetical protein
MKIKIELLPKVGRNAHISCIGLFFVFTYYILLINVAHGFF